MDSNYSNNPLTEVALALSMAFFSIMVLSIFVLSQKDINEKSKNELSINSNSKIAEKEKIKRTYIFYFRNNFYNKNLKEQKLEKIIQENKKYILAVSPQISVKELFEVKNSFKNIDVKITQQNNEWNNALKNKTIKRN